MRFDDISRALPDLDELRPVLDHLLSTSVPDPARRWSGSGELDTSGARLIDPGEPDAAADLLAENERGHLRAVYGAVLRAVSFLTARDHAGAAEALLDAAALEEGRGRASRAEAYAEQARRAAESGRESRTIALALRRQARAARALGRLPAAEELYASGYELAKTAGDHRGAAEGAIGAGNVLEEQGRWAEAKAWYSEALELIEPVEGPTPEKWHAFLNLHVVTRSLGLAEESIEWLRRAERAAADLGDASARPIIGNAWGQLYMARGSFGLAIHHYRGALSARMSSRAAVTIRLNLGEALLAQGRVLEAAEEVREAEREAVSAGLAMKLPEVYRLLGRIASERLNPDAFVLFERALQIVRERGLPPLEEAITLQAYADASRVAGDQEGAERLMERARELYRSLGIHTIRSTWADSYEVAHDLPPGGSPADMRGYRR